MRVRITEIRLRPTGKKVRIDREVDVDSLFIGRGPDNDLSLKGLTIALHQATLRLAEGRLYVEAASGHEVEVNGLVTNGERLGPGDRLRIGAWELHVLEVGSDSGFDVALEYEEVERAKGERSALDERTRLGLESGPLARRPLSWLGVGLVVVGFFVIPLVWSPAQSPWSTGEVSRGHAYVESDCQQCHSGFFQPVQNEDCLSCHHDTGRHSSPAMAVAELDEAACATCHLEHRGREVDLAGQGSGFCSDCHTDLAALVPATSLRDASDFGDDHPIFKLSLVADPDEEAISVDYAPGLVEVSGIDFNHLRHVGQGVTGRGDRKQYLTCGECHQPDAGGFYMQPIEFEEHCQDCHRLDFDAKAPVDFVPHGDPVVIRERLRGFYSTRVLEGTVRDEAAPRRLRRRRPGSRLTAEEAELSRRWVEQKVAAVERRFYEQPGTCDLCHSLEPGGARDGGMAVETVQIQDRWVPGSTFSHGSHAPFACVQCHPGAGAFDPEPGTALSRPDWAQEDAVPYGLIGRTGDARVSERSGDVLIPGIAVCRECHSGASASGGAKVPSPCSMCHPFHVRANGPMDGSTSVEEATTTDPSSDPSVGLGRSGVHRASGSFAVRPHMRFGGTVGRVAQNDAGAFAEDR